MKSICEFKGMKSKGKKISVVTCYDFWSAKIIAVSEIDTILVGDSGAMIMHGFESTINAEMTMMVYHVSAVKRGAANKFIIADLPFLEHRKGVKNLFQSIDCLLKAGANAVKIEGADGNLEMIEKLVQTGIPVMGHLGLTPQSINKLGGYKLQGKDEKTFSKILDDAVKLESAGCFSIVLEMIPAELGRRITEKLSIPTIGIGAGAGTDGQVLVLHDLLGFDRDFDPKFVRKYLNGQNLILNALNNYNNDVKQNSFPSAEESN
jgi:3-methyl-2-oxobutanoate hydroxymethyltransferase